MMSFKKVLLLGGLLSVGAAFCTPVQPDYSLLVKRAQATSDVVIAVPGGSLFMGDMQIQNLYAVPMIKLCYAMYFQQLVSLNPALKKIVCELRKQIDANPFDASMHIVLSDLGLLALTSAGYDLSAKQDLIFRYMQSYSSQMAPDGKTFGFDVSQFQSIFKKMHGLNYKENVLALKKHIGDPSWALMLEAIDVHYPAASDAVREYNNACQACLDFGLSWDGGDVLQAELQPLMERINESLQSVAGAFGCDKLNSTAESTPGSSFSLNMNLNGTSFLWHEFIGSYFGFAKRWDFDAAAVQPKVIAWISQENVQAPVAWYDIEKNIVYTDLAVTVGAAERDDVFVSGSMQRDGDGKLVVLAFDSQVTVASLSDGADLIQAAQGKGSDVTLPHYVAFGRLQAFENALKFNSNIIQVPACAQRFVVSCKPCGTDVTVPVVPVAFDLIEAAEVVENSTTSITGATEIAPSEDDCAA